MHYSTVPEHNLEYMHMVKLKFAALFHNVICLLLTRNQYMHELKNYKATIVITRVGVVSFYNILDF